MDILDKNYWNQRYFEHDTGWDAGNVTLPLKIYFDQLINKTLRILIPGAGNAHEAEYLHQQGFKNVFVIDIARAPLENFRKRCPEFPEGHLIEGDFFELKGAFDLIIEQTFFCALNPSLRPEYAAKMHKLLNPGGKLIGLLFGVPLNQDHPPFGGSKEEYLQYFEPYFIVETMEIAYNSIKPREGRELFIKLLRLEN